MVIRNLTSTRIHYRLSGGPTDMTFSEADLEPGEEDEWEPPVFSGTVACHVHFAIAEGREEGLKAPEGPWVGHATSDFTVSLIQDGETKRIRVG